MRGKMGQFLSFGPGVLFLTDQQNIVYWSYCYAYLSEIKIKSCLLTPRKKKVTQPVSPRMGKMSHCPNWPRRLACAMHSLAIVITIVQSLFLSFFSLFSPSFFAFYPLRGIFRVRKFVSPNILAELEDIYKFIFIFLRKKGDFSDVFSAFYGQCSVTAAWATRSPWSIFISF